MCKYVGKYHIHIQKAIEHQHWAVLSKIITKESLFWYDFRGHINDGLLRVMINNWDHMPTDLKAIFSEACFEHTFGTAPFNVAALSLGREDLLRTNEKQTMHASM